MPDSSLILHHYAISPYSQKIRVMLGYAGLEWQSVITAEAPPRPALSLLAGGYRKIPVAQIGADIFCDSHVIAREIAIIADRKELLVENLGSEAQALMARAEDDLFFACGLGAASFTMMRKMFKIFSVAGYLHFMRDRMAMGKGATLPFPGFRASQQMVQQHLHALERQLNDDFLFGVSPNLADFAVYHGIWMLQVLGEKSFMRQFPKVVAWVERMGRFDKARFTSLSADDALAVAHAHVPRRIDPSFQTDALIGKDVTIAPTDYAKDATQGVLVGSTPHSWILARRDKLVGTVHVHFPKIGYALA